MPILPQSHELASKSQQRYNKFVKTPPAAGALPTIKVSPISPPSKSPDEKSLSNLGRRKPSHNTDRLIKTSHLRQRGKTQTGEINDGTQSRTAIAESFFNKSLFASATSPYHQPDRSVKRREQEKTCRTDSTSTWAKKH